MLPSRPMPVELIPEERALVSQIRFGDSSHDALQRSCQLSAPFTRSLLDRGAIPELRVRYVTDPALNGRGTRSRKEDFERHGIRGDAIFSHGHFLKYLRYFIFGPDLPAAVIDEFYSLVGKEAYYPGDNIDELREFARSATRTNGLNSQRASEEFFKLALECGVPDGCAWDIRRAVRSVR